MRYRETVRLYNYTVLTILFHHIIISKVVKADRSNSRKKKLRSDFCASFTIFSLNPCLICRVPPKQSFLLQIPLQETAPTRTTAVADGQNTVAITVGSRQTARKLANCARYPKVQFKDSFPSIMPRALYRLTLRLVQQRSRDRDCEDESLKGCATQNRQTERKSSVSS